MTTFYITPTKPRLSRWTLEAEIKRVQYLLQFGKFDAEDKAWTEKYLLNLQSQLYSLEPTKKELKQAR